MLPIKDNSSICANVIQSETGLSSDSASSSASVTELPYFKRLTEAQVVLFLNLVVLCQQCLDLARQLLPAALSRYRNAGRKPT